MQTTYLPFKSAQATTAANHWQHYTTAARRFALDWAHEADEKGEAHSCWDESLLNFCKLNLAIRSIGKSNVKWNNEGNFLNDAHRDLIEPLLRKRFVLGYKFQNGNSNQYSDSIEPYLSVPIHLPKIKSTKRQNLMEEKTIQGRKGKQVKSKKRVADHGEVFTNEREVNAMLDLVKQETERIDSRFLEPACGDGNFLAEVLRRKLAVVDNRYSKSQLEWERYAVIAVSSIYGVDILEDNAIECRARLFKIFDDKYSALFKDKCKGECRNSVKFILNRNILWGDALDFTNPETKEPIVFSEWSAVNGNLFKRRDYVFRFLVEKTHQFTLFNDEGKPAAIDEPVKDFPLQHFLKLGEDDSNELQP